MLNLVYYSGVRSICLYRSKPRSRQAEVAKVIICEKPKSMTNTKPNTKTK